MMIKTALATTVAVFALLPAPALADPYYPPVQTVEPTEPPYYPPVQTVEPTPCDPMPCVIAEDAPLVETVAPTPVRKKHKHRKHHRKHRKHHRHCMAWVVR